MGDCKRNVSSGAVDKIIGNMTSDVHNADGQFIQLGFTPPSTPVVEGLSSWGIHNEPQSNHYYGVHNPDTFAAMDQHYNQVPIPFNFIQSSQIYNQELCYQNLQNDVGMFPPDYKLFVNQNNMPQHHYLPNQENVNGVVLNSVQSPTNRTQLIENLVGNWVVPNTSGTYSPFGGNTQSNKMNTGIFEPEVEVVSNNVIRQVFEEPKQQDFTEQLNLNDENPFPFNRESSKKHRIVAEIKPMRPTYSDVLTKSAPQTFIKTNKTDLKDSKQKKENKKSAKNEKTLKQNSSINRSGTNIETKDVPNERNAAFSKIKEKPVKNGKINQLNRKWVSLDDVSEPFDGLKDEFNDSRRFKKPEDVNTNKTVKVNQKKNVKNNTDIADDDLGNNKNDYISVSKNVIKKSGKVGLKQKNYDNFVNERSIGKRVNRNRKRDNHSLFGIFASKLKQYLRGWWKIFLSFVLWLIHLISDICSLSIHISHDMLNNLWTWLITHWGLFLETALDLLQNVWLYTWIWEKIRQKKEPEENSRNFLHSDLQHNINMPTTGEEAMKRLLACKGKDPYSILGVTPTCTDDDIKKYYKRQAFLVHPDKNQQPGAEEAFKILVHAFDMIGKPEKRAAYDRGVVESAQVEQAWSELTELLAKLQQKVEAAANTIRCSACGLRHKRIKIDRPSYAARNCTTCKIHHSAREGDIWAEAKCLGFLWHYYACMEGGVYDITEWAGCQKDSLKHLRPNSHHVQYRIVLGKQNGQSRRHSSSPRSERPPDLENLLNSLYGQSDNSQNNRRRNKKTTK